MSKSESTPDPSSKRLRRQKLQVGPTSTTQDDETADGREDTPDGCLRSSFAMHLEAVDMSELSKVSPVDVAKLAAMLPMVKHQPEIGPDPRIEKAIRLIAWSAVGLRKFRTKHESGSEWSLLEEQLERSLEGSDFEPVKLLPGGEAAYHRLVAYALSHRLAKSCTADVSRNGFSGGDGNGEFTQRVALPWKGAVVLSLLVGTHEKLARRARLKVAGWNQQEIETAEVSQLANEAQIVEMAKKILPALRPPPRRPKSRETGRYISKTPPQKENGKFRSRQ